MKNWINELLFIEGAYYQDGALHKYLNKPTYWGYGQAHHLYVWPWRATKAGSIGTYNYSQYQAHCRAIKIYDSRPWWQKIFIRSFSNIEFIRSTICALSLSNLLGDYIAACAAIPERFGGNTAIFPAPGMPEIVHEPATGRTRDALGPPSWAPAGVKNIPPEWDIYAEFERLISEQHRKRVEDGLDYGDFNRESDDRVCRTITRSYLIKCLITTQKISDAKLDSPFQAHGFNDWNLLDQLRKISTRSAFYPTAQRMVALLDNPAIVKEMMEYQGEISEEAAKKYVYRPNPKGMVYESPKINKDQAALDCIEALKILGLYEKESFTPGDFELAYRAAARRMHPDKSDLDEKTATEKMALLNTLRDALKGHFATEKIFYIKKPGPPTTDGERLRDIEERLTRLAERMDASKKRSERTDAETVVHAATSSGGGSSRSASSERASSTAAAAAAPAETISAAKPVELGVEATEKKEAAGPAAYTPASSFKFVPAAKKTEPIPIPPPSRTHRVGGGSPSSYSREGIGPSVSSYSMPRRRGSLSIGLEAPLLGARGSPFGSYRDVINPSRYVRPGDF